MATLTLSSAPSGLSKSVTITAAEVARIIAAYKSVYGKINDGTEGDPVWRDRTDPEVFDAFAAGLFRDIRDTVARVEREAGRAAADAIVPVSVP